MLFDDDMMEPMDEEAGDEPVEGEEEMDEDLGEEAADDKDMGSDDDDV